MPVLVNYGTYDTAMPIEQGAQRIIATANKSGNENVTVRYFAGNHQMRAGEAYSPRTCHWPKAIRKRWKIG